MYERTLTGRADQVRAREREGLPQPSTGTNPMLRLVAHELRAHVTVLSGYSELLDDEAVRNDPERCRVALAAIRSHLESLREMATHLTQAVAPASTDKLVYQPGTVDLATAAQEAVEFTRGVARSRGIRMECDLSRLEGGSGVHGDRFHLVTAMRNLLENACRYGPPGGSVRLSLVRRDGDIEVLVHDQGEGLRLIGDDAFQPGSRGSRSAEQAPEGLGLGLSLVAQVAQLHGGVAVWGDDGDGGAVIGFRFPAPLPQQA